MDPGASSPEKLDKENLVGKFIFPALSLFHVYYTKNESCIIAESEHRLD